MIFPNRVELKCVSFLFYKMILNENIMCISIRKRKNQLIQRKNKKAKWYSEQKSFKKILICTYLTGNVLTCL